MWSCRKKFIEQELAKRLGKSIDSHENEDPETRRKRLEAEMYQIPDEYKVMLWLRLQQDCTERCKVQA
jgi:hypothetical protein